MTDHRRLYPKEDSILALKLMNGEDIIARYVRIAIGPFNIESGYIVNYPSILNNGVFAPWLKLLDGSCYGSDIFLPSELIGLAFAEEDIDPVLVENFRETVLCP